MIRVIEGIHRRQFASEIDAMHVLRKKVFHDRMRWEVPIINTWEVDGFDALNPLYLLSMNGEGEVVGSLRLLPTMGFNMLNDVFAELLPDGKPIASPTIWESSRFSVDHHADISVGKGISRATAELGLAMNELGQRYGLTHVVTVYDALMHRLLKRAGCEGEPISEPRRIGKSVVYAVFFEVGADTERRLRQASGIEGSVIEAVPPISFNAAA